MSVIDNFEGTERWLSNFWMQPFFSSLVHMPVKSVEHVYQAMKTLDMQDQVLVLGADTPGRAKRFGRMVDIRPDWDIVKNHMMFISVWEKFYQNDDLKQRLLDTGNAELIEGNDWGDTYWGVCRGQGQNKLGQILMDVRCKLSA